MRYWLLIVGALLALAACAAPLANPELGAAFRPPEVELAGGG